MSVEVKSNQFLYNIIELTHRKKYSRVIRICEFLESQGISSHEFIIVRSYALAQMKGYEEALIYLQQYEGILVNTAKTQYQQMLEMFTESRHLFDNLTTVEGTSIMQLLRENNNILSGVREESIQDIFQGEENRCCRFIINKKQEEILMRINKVSSAYEEQKYLFLKQSISKDEMNQRCMGFIKQYQQIASTFHIKGKIKHIIEQYIAYLNKLIEGTL